MVFHPVISRGQIREPRENRGRLRHCNGLQIPTATAALACGGKAGRRLEVRSQDIGLIMLVAWEKVAARPAPRVGGSSDFPSFSVKEKDEAGLPLFGKIGPSFSDLWS